MPDPKDFDNESDWMAACVPTRKEEGDADDQAKAACLSMWSERKSVDYSRMEYSEDDPRRDGDRITITNDADALVYHGGSVKALGKGRVGGYLVRFTSEDEPDLEKEWFDGKTWYGDAAESPVYYNHGLDPTLGRRVLGKGALEAQDVGMWIEAQLEMRDEYERAVYALAEKGKLGWSSGTAPHLVEREGKHILRWPLGLDASLTPTPADPGNRAMPLKAWAESVKHLKTLLEVEPDGARETPPEGEAGSVTIKAESVHISVNQSPTERGTTTEDTTMSEKEEVKAAETPQPEPVDVKAIVQEAVAETVNEMNKAWQERLENEPPIKSAGFAVEDEADRALKGNPFKSFGGFLQAVADAETPGKMDQRLMPLASTETDVKGYFDLSKAMPEVVGNAYQSSMKAWKQTGLNEGVGAQGGFLVGTDQGGSLMDRVYGVGELLRRVDTVPISANSNGMTFYGVNETSRADGSRRGGILAYHAAEAATKTASMPTFREMELRLHKIIGLVYATDELLADASALEAWIMRNLPEELRFVAENDIIRGTGVGMALGILASPCLVTQGAEVGQAANTVVAENVINMWSRRWAGARDYVWIVNQDVTPQLHLMGIGVGTGGQLVYMPPGGLSQAPYGTLLGRPVIESEYADTVGDLGDIILASLGEYQAITKGGIESASSIHVRFVNDETCFRFVMRFCGQPKWNAPLTPFQSALTQSPFVVLEAR